MFSILKPKQMAARPITQALYLRQAVSNRVSSNRQLQRCIVLGYMLQQVEKMWKKLRLVGRLSLKSRTVRMPASISMISSRLNPLPKASHALNVFIDRSSILAAIHRHVMPSFSYSASSIGFRLRNLLKRFVAQWRVSCWKPQRVWMRAIQLRIRFRLGVEVQGRTAQASWVLSMLERMRGRQSVSYCGRLLTYIWLISSSPMWEIYCSISLTLSKLKRLVVEGSSLLDYSVQMFNTLLREVPKQRSGAQSVVLVCSIYCSERLYWVFSGATYNWLIISHCFIIITTLYQHTNFQAHQYLGERVERAG